MFEMIPLEPFPPNSWPFHYDLFHMGRVLGKNLVVMHPNHDHGECNYIILVNTVTGERVRIDINNEENKP